MRGYGGLSSERRCSSQQRWKPWEGPMLWNKSKQMGSVAEAAWHNEEGGGMAAQQTHWSFQYLWCPHNVSQQMLQAGWPLSSSGKYGLVSGTFWPDKVSPINLSSIYLSILYGTKWSHKPITTWTTDFILWEYKFKIGYETSINSVWGAVVLIWANVKIAEVMV